MSWPESSEPISLTDLPGCSSNCFTWLGSGSLIESPIGRFVSWAEENDNEKPKASKARVNRLMMRSLGKGEEGGR